MAFKIDLDFCKQVLKVNLMYIYCPKFKVDFWSIGRIVDEMK